MSNLIVKHAHTASVHHDLACCTLLTSADFLQEKNKMSKNLRYASFKGVPGSRSRPRNRSLQTRCCPPRCDRLPTPAPENRRAVLGLARHKRSLTSGCDLHVSLSPAGILRATQLVCSARPEQTSMENADASSAQWKRGCANGRQMFALE